MHYEIAAQWAFALKSGQYEQGRGVLHAKKDGKDKFCCLGVLCKVAQKHAIHVDEQPTRGEYGEFLVSYGRNGIMRTGGLPLHVQHWAGLYTDMGTNRKTTGVESLVAMNDRGKSFSEIADYIINNYKDL